MEIEIEIETSDHQLLNDLLENPPSPTEPGHQKPLTNGATLALKSHVKRRGINIPPESITLVLTLGTSVATNILSSWLYEKLKGRTLNLHINRKETPVVENAIQTIIEETIKKQE
jgi:molecular chaperone DnaK (HSP70)